MGRSGSLVCFPMSQEEGEGGTLTQILPDGNLNFSDCAVGVWRVFGVCLKGVWKVS